MSSDTNIWETGVNDNGNGTDNNQYFISDTSDAEKRLTIQRGTGNIGIGTNEPSQLLDVSGNINLSGNIYLSNTGTIYKNDIEYAGGSEGTSTLWQENGTKIHYNAGNVGINTSDPTETLEVVGNIKATSLEGTGTNITALDADNITSGTISNAILPANISATNISATNISGDGSGITNLDATELTGIIDNNRLPADISITGDLTAKNLNVTGSTTTIYTDTYQTENLEIISTGADGPSLKITHNTTSSINIMQVTDTTGTQSLTMTHDGNIGIGTNNPLAPLHIYDTSDVLKVSNSEITINRNILPETNDSVDIGSAERKIRDMYISDNSLWIGDDHKLAVSGDGTMKFRKRKKSTLPKVLRDASGDDGAAVAYINSLHGTSYQNVTELKLNHVLSYARTINPEYKTSDIFGDETEDYDQDTAADAWQINNSKIYLGSGYTNIGIGTNDPDPNFKLHVDGNVHTDGTISADDITIKGSDASGSGSIKLNCEANSHGVSIKGPPHSANQSYTLTLPSTAPEASKVLSTDGSGNLSWIDPGSSSASSIQNITTTASKVTIDTEMDVTNNVTIKGSGDTGSGSIKLNCEANSHGVSIKGPPHSANQSYTLTLPSTAPEASKVLSTDGSGNLSWIDQASGGDGSSGGEVTSVTSNILIRKLIEPTTTPNITHEYVNGSQEYKIITFEYDSGDTNANDQTEYIFNAPEELDCDILVIAGGGGGGATDAAGGGAGGLIYETGVKLDGEYTIKVGNCGVGGAGGTNVGNNPGLKGKNSQIQGGHVLVDYDAVGGGGGGSGHPNNIEPNPAGGGSSGGLGSGDTSRDAANIHVDGQGYSGGTGGGTYGGGGGGGAGGIGGNANNYAGAGGIGREIDITGTATYYAGGGGGGFGKVGSTWTNVDGGLGGGGRGSATGNGLDATYYGGGGGGGGSGWGSGGDGYKGLVMIRYKIKKIFEDVTSLFQPKFYTMKEKPQITSGPVAQVTDSYVTGNDMYKYMMFTYDATNDNGSGQTEYALNFLEDTTIDLLIVGGGGGGADSGGGGGGAGGVLLAESILLNHSTNYNIKVGKGGDGVGTNNGNNGVDSEFESIAVLGGGGGRGWQAQVGHNGGSGGGGGANNNSSPNTNGSSIQSKDKTTYGILYTLTNNGAGLNIYGENGGDGGINSSSSDLYDALGGGGGGATQVGFSGVSANGSNAGKGGDGINLSYLFGNSVGENGYFAGGGGAGSDGDMPTGLPGLGGGGQGYGQASIPNIDGRVNTGGGGGGAYRSSISGAGGSGVVIIRYLAKTLTQDIDTTLATKAGENIEWDTDNNKFTLSSNVAITSNLDVYNDINFMGNLYQNGELFVSGNSDEPIKLTVENIIAPTSSPAVLSYDISDESEYKTIYFTYDSGNVNASGQTEYTLNFSNSTECDILLVGGGGGGGSDNSGAGGAGGLVFLENITLNNGVTINVGGGGAGAASGQSNTGQLGKDSTIIFGETYIAKGGGGGGTGQSNATLNSGTSGGSGGGSAYEAHDGSPGTSTQDQYLLNGARRGWGFAGGDGKVTSGSGQGAGGGGGGASEVGINGIVPGNKLGGHGGDGKYEVNGSDFKTIFNITDTTIGDHIDDKVYFAGGGGGGNDNDTNSTNLSDGSGYNNRGGFGGGGDGGYNSSNKSNPGIANTGGGGGGATYYGSNYKGGDGGSGIVILRYKYRKSLNIPSHYYVANSGPQITLGPLAQVTDSYVTGSELYKYMMFTYDATNDNGSGQTEYTLNFSKNTNADILVVAGGGAGGIDAGGGGGGGGVAYTTTQIKLFGEYTIKVGKGGIFTANVAEFAEDQSSDGKNSSITNETDTIEVVGGGSGAYLHSNADDGNNGGSSGGGDYNNTEPPGAVVASTKTGIFANINTTGGQGNTGGNGYAGGGGGAGGAISSSTADGNDGIQNNIDGNNYYWAGGGAGGFNNNYTTGTAYGGKGGGGGGGNWGNATMNTNNANTGGVGGINAGEDGTYNGNAKGGDGGQHTGSGGAGGGNAAGGNGGSGVVIIRYLAKSLGQDIDETLKTKAGENIEWDNTAKKYNLASDVTIANNLIVTGNIEQQYGMGTTESYLFLQSSAVFQNDDIELYENRKTSITLQAWGPDNQWQSFGLSNKIAEQLQNCFTYFLKGNRRDGNIHIITLNNSQTNATADRKYYAMRISSTQMKVWGSYDTTYPLAYSSALTWVFSSGATIYKTF